MKLPRRLPSPVLGLETLSWLLFQDELGTNYATVITLHKLDPCQELSTWYKPLDCQVLPGLTQSLKRIRLCEYTFACFTPIPFHPLIFLLLMFYSLRGTWFFFFFCQLLDKTHEYCVHLSLKFSPDVFHAGMPFDSDMPLWEWH